MEKNWDASEKWYTSIVGKDGHYYHKKIVLPNVLRLLGKFSSLLDIGCGQGVLARSIKKDVSYLGVDVSKALIQTAKKLSKGKLFILQDACTSFQLDQSEFERATMILSLQNMENGKNAIRNAAKHLKKEGKLLIVLNHPCFRIPRQSGWGVDEGKKQQYRRVDSYMSSLKIPIQTNPSQKGSSATTMSYHHPLSAIVKWLAPDLLIETIEEWCSDKTSTGKKAKMENRARKEIPLFLAILARKG